MGGYAARLHGRIAVSAAARHFIDRFFPGDYKVIPNGVDVDALRSGPSRSRAGRTGTPNLLFVGRHEPRKGLLDLLKAYRILRKTGCECRLLVVGSGPQEREARRYVATRGLQGVEFLGRVSDEREGAALPDRGRLRLAGDRRRVVRDRAARGDGRRRADRRLGHPRLQGRRPARPRGPPRAAARAEGSSPPRSPGSSRDAGPAGRDERGRAWPAPRSSAGRGSRPRSRTTTASSIRRLAASGELPAGFTPTCRRRAPADAGRSSRRRPPSGCRGRLPGRPASVSPARSRAGRPFDGSPRRPPFREREPPDPGRVGDDEARHASAPRRGSPAPASKSGGRRAGRRADRELEGVQVGRQDALVGVRRSSTAAAAPRCSGRGRRTSRRPRPRARRRSGARRATASDLNAAR